MRLTVDARSAHYPITVDPIAQQAYVKASNTDAGDFSGFGGISGDTVVVGATWGLKQRHRVNGDQTDNSALCWGRLRFRSRGRPGASKLI